jgi:colanic acid biosynthesis glycosyl transferase WcaI
MKLLIYGINYHPELAGIGKYTAEMCSWLAARGHQVEVITSLPYYPSWKVYDNYKGKWWHTEIINKVKVHRCPLYVPGKVTGPSRMIHELSFLLSSSCFWLGKFFRNYDAVIAVYPPLAIGFYPSLYKLIRQKSFIFHIQDLQVDAAKELGMIKSKVLLKLLEKTEKFFLNKASRVSSISEEMRNRILLKGLNPEKYFSLPNWADTRFIKPSPPNPEYKRKLGFKPEDKIILYSGNMGEKQGLEMLLRVAEKFSEEKDIYFVLAGEGMMKQSLKDKVKRKKINNIRFLGLQPYEDLPDFLSMAEVHLVLQKKAASGLVMPSKLTGILAAGALAIVTAEKNTELFNILTLNQMAIVIEPENEDMLFEALRKSLVNPVQELKSNARKFAESHLNMEGILPELEIILAEINN